MHGRVVDRPASAGIVLIVAAIALGCSVTIGWFDAGDRAIIFALAPLRSNAWPWLLLTRLGDGDTRILFCAIAALLLWRRGDRRAALFLPIATLAETLATSGLKLVFGRIRPDLFAHLDHVTSLSYPSGHAAHNVALWLLAATLLVPGRRGLIAIALCFATAIGVSRIVLGVHWPTDVVGGLAFGIGAALLALSMFRQTGTITAAAT